MSIFTAQNVIVCLAVAIFLGFKNVYAQYNLAECISTDRHSNSITDFLISRCNVALNVRFTDEGDCRRGCMLTVYPGRKESAGKLHGRVVFSACEYPSIPSPARLNKYSCD